MSTVQQREVRIPLGIVVERRRSDHPWADATWVPVSVFMHAPKASWMELLRTDDLVRYHAATLPLTLHRKETEALVMNLALDDPELYVVLHKAEGRRPIPYDVHLVTASSYEAQDQEDSGDAIIGKVPMPEPVAALVQAFVAEHHREETFKKRRRDRVDLEERKFGKVPIFEDPTRDR